jgi:hypothetical protein
LNPSKFSDDIRVMVVAGQSSYYRKGLRINQNETFETFLGKFLQPRVVCRDSQLVITDEDDGELVIRFHRTLRLPENGEVHKLPANLGLLSLNPLSKIAPRMMKSGNESLIDMAKKGGVFFPLYQREAMWLRFTSSKPFAIRIFAGGVNAISGSLWNTCPQMTKTNPYTYAEEKDYVAVPPQLWLDGFAVNQQTVKQFVAMPLGAGYSVEGQITGHEVIGGLQLEIIPSGPRTDRLKMGSKSITETNTPKQEGLQPGAALKMARPDTFSRYHYKVPIFVRTLYFGGDLDQDLRVNEWRPGVTVNMVAVYKYSITIQGASTETVHVEWAPWDNISDCIKRTHFRHQRLSSYILSHNGRRLENYTGKTLDDLGFKDNDTIRVREYYL